MGTPFVPLQSLQIFSTLFQPRGWEFLTHCFHPAQHRFFYNSKMYITMVFTQRAVQPKTPLLRATPVLQLKYAPTYVYGICLNYVFVSTLLRLCHPGRWLSSSSSFFRPRMSSTIFNPSQYTSTSRQPSSLPI